MISQSRIATATFDKSFPRHRRYYCCLAPQPDTLWESIMTIVDDMILHLWACSWPGLSFPRRIRKQLVTFQNRKPTALLERSETRFDYVGRSPTLQFRIQWSMEPTSLDLATQTHFWVIPRDVGMMGNGPCDFWSKMKIMRSHLDYT